MSWEATRGFLFACDGHIAPKARSQQPPRFSVSPSRKFGSAPCAHPSLSAAVAHIMTWACISILAVSGGFGGFIAALRNPFANSLRLPFWSATLNLGCLGDVFVGVAAALVSYTFLGMLPTSGPVSTTNLSEEIALKFVGLGIAAGYAGIRILDRAALEMLRAKQDQ